ncbi:DUF2252 domain-containing protein [Actinacidiphila paucisporea]|uniref:Uncharacterized conserved protein, DUF2252 family n=1 Tax=Actinacidiphila paucisporea TaxID=310782 RepID=A0A1M6ZJ65_9ACTN|nr:DUF2252 domain-containing protein [Actinacidiphila paucisporea]SHL30444.1 Uncharacterized conserved protein, DUF2252 family [Actinacidiphila paucisporea]
MPDEVQDPLGNAVPHGSPAERAAYGKAARRRVPRSAQARLGPGKKRFDPVDLLERQSADRLPELVPIRYGRMLESPFRFYRGAAGIMAADLGTAPHTGLTAQLCGDAHLLNFRLLASPERHLVFDINDFDETLPGPFEWDLKRLATSLEIAARARGFGAERRGAIVRGAVEAYRERMQLFAGMGTLDIWYAQDDTEQLTSLLPKEQPGASVRKRTGKALAKARTRTTAQAFDKLTHVEDGQRRITPDPPLITPLRDLLPDEQRARLEKLLHELLHRYGQSLPAERRLLLSRFRVVDMARKVVGVGSVGTRCWIILAVGRDDEDPLLLQAKEAGPSVLTPYAGAARYDNQGQRVVAGQRLMQSAGDILLGWERATGFDGRQRDFYVRQLRDWKGIAQPDTMTSTMLRLFARLCGASLARAHARSGDPVALSAYAGGGEVLDRALAEFAEAYADRNERDYQALAAAAADGRVPVSSEPTTSDTPVTPG